MKFIRPVQITTPKLTAHSVAENDYAAWLVGTTYALAAKCISTTTHRIYESIQAGNTGHDPTTDDGTWWLDIGPTNRWAMFDQTVGTVTTSASPMTLTIAPGTVVDSLALLDMAAQTVRVVMTNATVDVYDQTYTLGEYIEPVDWYQYFFSEIQTADTLIINDLPPYASASIALTLTSTAAIGVGTLVVGTLIDVGKTVYGVGIGIIDYSRKETDVFGVTSVLERAYAKRIEADVTIENSLIDYIARNLAAVRATPCVWVADNADGSLYASLVAYGFFKDWRINIPYPTISEASFTIEGLT